MQRGTARFGVVALLAVSFFGVAGCSEAQQAGRPAAPAGVRPATAEDLECSVEAISLQPEGGLPEQIRVTVRNKSAAVVAFWQPRPLIDEQTIAQAKEPLVVLGVALTDTARYEETAVYSRPRDKAVARGRAVMIPPGGTWFAVYPLNEFYFWGPSGPDTGGDFTRYFWRGDKELALRAMVLFEATNARFESKPITIRCSYEDWLFKKR